MTEKSNLPSALLEHIPWEAGSNPIWPATAFTVHRNLNRFNFPPKLSTPLFEQTLTQISEPLLHSPSLQKPILLKADNLTANDREFIYEHFLCTDGFQNSLSGQGFIVDASAQFLAMLNIDDHLQMRVIECQGNWENAWNMLNQLETAIGSAVEFAYLPRFGYLTADPRLCGTGLIIQAFLHLPAIIHTAQLPETLQKQKEEGITALGMGGSPSELFGDLLVIYNSYTLGMSEDTILHDIYSTAMKLTALEKTLRSHLKNDNNLEMKDQISRAYGLILHSYQLQTKEALNALSLIKLGIDLDWIDGITDREINALFFQCRRAHLSKILGIHLIDPQEISRNRAEYVHKHIQSIRLKIDN